MADARIGNGRKTDRYGIRRRSFPVPDGKKETARKLVRDTSLSRDDIKRMSSFSSGEQAAEIETKRSRDKFESTRIEKRADLERSKPQDTNKENDKAYYGKGGPILDLILKKEVKENYKGPVIRNIEGKIIHDQQAAVLEVINQLIPDIAKLLKQGKAVALVQWIIEKVLPNRDLVGVKLERKNLKNADLRRRDLSKANLYKADLSGANLEGAKLRRADLAGAVLSGANLKDTDLRDAFLDGADLSNANLENANLEGARIRKANLKGTDLKKAKLSGANITGSNIEDAKTDETVLDRDQSIRLAILGKDQAQLKMLAEKHGLRFHDLYRHKLWDKLYKPSEEVKRLLRGEDPDLFTGNGFSV